MRVGWEAGGAKDDWFEIGFCVRVWLFADEDLFPGGGRV